MGGLNVRGSNQDRTGELRCRKDFMFPPVRNKIETKREALFENKLGYKTRVKERASLESVEPSS